VHALCCLPFPKPGDALLVRCVSAAVRSYSQLADNVQTSHDPSSRRPELAGVRRIALIAPLPNLERDPITTVWMLMNYLLQATLAATRQVPTEHMVLK